MNNINRIKLSIEEVNQQGFSAYNTLQLQAVSSIFAEIGGSFELWKQLSSQEQSAISKWQGEIVNLPLNQVPPSLASSCIKMRKLFYPNGPSFAKKINNRDLEEVLSWRYATDRNLSMAYARIEAVSQQLEKDINPTLDLSDLPLITLPVFLFIEERFARARIILSHAFQRFPSFLQISSLRNVELYRQCENIIHPSASLKVLQDQNLCVEIASYFPKGAILPLKLSQRKWQTALELYTVLESSVKDLLTKESTPAWLDWLEGVWGEVELKTRKICDIIAEIGNLSLLSYAVLKGYEWNQNTLFIAAGKGRLDVLQWLRMQNSSYFLSGWIDACAAEGGHLDVLQWLHLQEDRDDNISVCAWKAAESGHLHVLQWLLVRNKGAWCEEVDMCSLAARGQYLHVLQWLRAQDPPCPWGVDVCVNAAQCGHLSVLQWLRAQDPPCPWGEEACAEALRGSHWHVLQWLRAQDPPCPWTEETQALAHAQMPQMFPL